ncbi:flagellar assembly protein FliH [Marinobacterium arenosum]|uniref:flagellar assembly protein FliH n=1 Tax=Marinobacterium arenosum TaxID=2862496 RepID=UPI001C971882|nr:flagellar assembly protein FliH [Marinobacterium arenosum]MBY4675947.1 flagellar assembly protein FliH [Marinobacterium arenosum]
MKRIDTRVARIAASDLPAETAGWDLPSVSGTRLFGFVQREGGRVEVVEEELAAEKLTVSELEEIRETAYQEGFAEGKKAGYEVGLPEGRAQGEQEGRQQGYEEGFGGGREKVEQLQQQLAEMIARQQAPLDGIAEQLENQVVEMVLQLSRAVVELAAEFDPQVVRQAVQEVIDQLPKPHENVRIRVHPAAVDIVTEMAQRNHESWQVVGDDSVEPGGCIVQTANTFADNTLAQRYQQVASQLRDYYLSRQDNGSAE